MNQPERPITIFTPSFADASNTNAQNLTVKEIVARLPAVEFKIVMLVESEPDERLARRPNTVFIRYYKHGNTPNVLARLLWSVPNVYFYPRWGPIDQGFLSARKRLRLKTALVTHIVMEMNDRTGKGMVERCVRESNEVFGNSEFVAKTVEQRFGVPAGVVWNGVDRRFYYPANSNEPSPRKPPVVLYAGSFQPRKQVEWVIRQAARLPGIEFHLAGKGETQGACRALAASLGCQNVSFLGHLSPSQLGDEMRAASVFLFPSILEGHPQVLGQAAACGLPSVAMELYHPDYVVHQKTGFLVKSESEMAAALDRLLTDSEVRNSMSLAAQQHALRFDWDQIAAAWAQVLRRVARER
jgi:glycosyltransferase involved in cell wall biosynthesis